MEYLIDVVNLTKYYFIRKKLGKKRLKIFGKTSTEVRKIAVVDNVTFHVRKGEAAVIIGPNGAGKTTLLKILCKLSLPDEGEARICGYDVTRLKHYQIARLATYISRDALLGKLKSRYTLRKTLEHLGIHYYAPHLDLNVVRERIDALLEYFDLSDFADDWVSKLSSGMKMRAILILSLLTDSPVYLMDEPTVNIDPLASRRLWRYIRRWCKGEGKTVLVVTQRVREAELVADRVFFMNKGRLVELGDVYSLKKLADFNVIDMVLDSKLDGLLKDIGELPGVLGVEYLGFDGRRSGHRFRVKVSAKNPPVHDVIWAALSGGAKILYFSLEEPTLEDIYMKMVGVDE